VGHVVEVALLTSVTKHGSPLFAASITRGLFAPSLFADDYCVFLYICHIFLVFIGIRRLGNIIFPNNGIKTMFAATSRSFNAL
jgi:hypothetical protein